MGIYKRKIGPRFGSVLRGYWSRTDRTEHAEISFLAISGSVSNDVYPVVSGSLLVLQRVSGRQDVGPGGGWNRVMEISVSYGQEHGG